NPTQIYEAVLEGLFVFILLHFLASRYKILNWTGLASGCFLLSYGTGRIISEFFRMEENIPYPWSKLIEGTFITQGMLLTFPLILIGIFLIVRSLIRGPRAEWYKLLVP
ncbi:MAG: prolipoprotein diacylglyceryl transferase, partial [Alphaproteobacteria bacterium]|nr:prolipoprotein diacylglyceryl transferase [Alphaproteobacteria bacterium]